MSPGRYAKARMEAELVCLSSMMDSGAFQAATVQVSTLTTARRKQIADRERFTVSFAGLVYLSLFLAAKFSVTIPFLAPAPFQEHTTQPGIGGLRDTGSQSHQPPRTSPRSQAAAPPIHLFVFVFIPIGAAIYIASTRYTDYKHHGFDVLFSSIEGSLCAWFAFRWYHMPIRRGAGWAWGPRSNDRAFGIRIGVGSYHQSKLQRNGKGTQDLEGNRQHSQGTEGIELTSRNTSNSSEGQRSVMNILGNTRP